MIEDTIRALLDDAAAFVREGDPTAALSRANEAVRACDLLSPWRGEIVEEAHLTRDRCEKALLRAKVDDTLRGDRAVHRERNQASSALEKSLQKSSPAAK